MAIVRVTQTPTVATTGHDVGRAVGGKLTFADVIAEGNHGMIVGCRLLDKSRQSVPLELWLFRGDFTPSGDNSLFAPSDSDLENLTAVVPVTDWFVTPENSIGQAENLPLSFVLNSGDRALYGQLVARGKPQYASSTAIVVELEVEQVPRPLARRRVYYWPRRYPLLSRCTITAAENFHTIHLKIEFEPPANLPPSTPHVSGSYLLNGRWVEFHPALLDDTGANTLYTILFGLQEDSTYPVKIEFSRTNNATGALIERKIYHETYKTRKSRRTIRRLTTRSADSFRQLATTRMLERKPRRTRQSPAPLLISLRATSWCLKTGLTIRPITGC